MRIPGLRRVAVGICLGAGLSTLLSLGCAGPQVASVTEPSDRRSTADSPVRVYLLRGLWDFFSLGLNSLADELDAQGIDATAVTGPNWPDLARAIIASRADQTDTRPLMLVGHSYGADDAVQLARTLNEQGIPIQLLYLLDATAPEPIPANVDHCVHLYIPNPLGHAVPHLFPGNPVVPEVGNTHTEIRNQVFSAQELGPGARGVDHFSIEESALVHELVTAEILSLSAKERAGP